MIGGADGPTAIYIAETADGRPGLNPDLLPKMPRRTETKRRRISRASDGERRFYPRLGAGVLRIIPALLPLHCHGCGHRFGGGLAMGRRSVAYNTLLAWLAAWAVYHLVMWL